MIIFDHLLNRMSFFEAAGEVKIGSSQTSLPLANFARRNL